MTEGKKDTASKDDAKGKGTLKISSPGKLSLTKTVESGKVQQKFTHGRSKNVTVEVRRTRTYQGGKAGMVEVKQGAEAAAAAEGNAKALDGLTEEERQARLKVLQNAPDKKAPTSWKGPRP